MYHILKKLTKVLTFERERERELIDMCRHVEVFVPIYNRRQLLPNYEVFLILTFDESEDAVIQGLL